MDETENAQGSNKKLNEDKSLQFDDLLRTTGGFGRYQAALFAFLCLVSIPAGAQVVITVFYGASPLFICVQSSDNETCDPGKCCSSCKKYEFRGPFTSAVSEWDLICDRRHLKAMTQAVFMAGLLFGSIVFSIISDRYGRKLSLFVSFGFISIFGVASAVADSLSLFSLFCFFAGTGTMGCILVRFVYCVEMAVTAYRSYIGIINMLFLSVGGCVLALLAYLIPHWRHLMLAVSLSSVLPLFAWWWIPRSPRWLIANDHLEEAQEVLLKYATNNHVTVDPKQLRHMIRVLRENDARKAADEKYGILDTVKTPRLRKRSLILLFNWFANALIFFGLKYNVGNLAGNMYLNFLILFVVDIPSAAFCSYCLQRFGRRLTYSSLMVFCGVACLLTLTIPGGDEFQVGVVILVIIAKFFIFTTFTAVYVFTAELYPTVIRNNGVGLSAMISRFGGIVAPYIVLLADLPNLRNTFPLLIFGVLGVAAGIMAFWLPETITSQMPQTVEQAEAWDEDYNIYCCKHPRIRTSRGLEVKADECETNV